MQEKAEAYSKENGHEMGAYLPKNVQEAFAREVVFVHPDTRRVLKWKHAIPCSGADHWANAKQFAPYNGQSHVPACFVQDKNAPRYIGKPKNFHPGVRYKKDKIMLDVSFPLFPNAKKHKPAEKAFGSLQEVVEFIERHFETFDNAELNQSIHIRFGKKTIPWKDFWHSSQPYQKINADLAAAIGQSKKPSPVMASIMPLDSGAVIERKKGLLMQFRGASANNVTPYIRVKKSDDALKKLSIAAAEGRRILVAGPPYGGHMFDAEDALSFGIIVTSPDQIILGEPD